MFDTILSKWVEILAVWGAICIIADTITGMTASSKDDAIWAKIKTVITSIISLKKK